MQNKQFNTNSAVTPYFEKMCIEDSNIGTNEVNISTPREAMQNIERKLLGKPPLHAVGEMSPYSQIAIFSQSLDKINKKHESLYHFWEFVNEKIIVPDKAEAALVLHDGKIPHIHLLIRYQHRIPLIKVAESLDEYMIDKSGQKVYLCDYLDYLYENLYTSFESITHNDDLNGNIESTCIIEITPAFAKYLILQDYAWSYDAYKRNLLKGNI